MSLISELTDPVLRIDVASTIQYVFSLFSSGDINEAQAKDTLFDVCRDVLRETKPTLTDVEIKKKAATMADEFIKAFKVESVRRRVMSRFRIRL